MENGERKEERKKERDKTYLTKHGLELSPFLELQILPHDGQPAVFYQRHGDVVLPLSLFLAVLCVPIRLKHHPHPHAHFRNNNSTNKKDGSTQLEKPFIPLPCAFSTQSTTTTSKRNLKTLSLSRSACVFRRFKGQ